MAGWSVTFPSILIVMVSYRRRRRSRRRFPYRRRRSRRMFRRKYRSARRRYIKKRSSVRFRRSRFSRRRFRRHGSFITGNSVFGPYEKSRRLVLTSAVPTIDRPSVPATANPVTVTDYHNPLGYFTVNVEPNGIIGARPRTFPPADFGTFLVFSLDNYINATARNWVSYHIGINQDNVTNSSYGIYGNSHPDELLYRRYSLHSYMQSLYKIQLIFRRRLGRAVSANAALPNYTKSVETIAAPNGGGTVVGGNLSVSSAELVPTTAGELPWYSQYVKGIYTGNELINGFRAGMAWGTAPDNIVGTSVSAIHRRTQRIFSEMNSAGVWNKHSATGSLCFEIASRRRTNDGVIPRYNPRTYEKVDISNADNTSYVECNLNMSPITHIVGGTGENANFVTHPCITGPTGSVVIWIPYNKDMLATQYDVSVRGFYKFKGKGGSLLDMRTMPSANVV